jgi:hypothetical protein
MKKLIWALFVGAGLGWAASAATAPSAGGNCGPITCVAHQECCVSPAPFTYRCVKPGHCPYNN